ncbi:MAG: sugar ABC transporter permease [Spirochaetaceae bacterium]|jgi:putative multiple sugar transport system permease protein|nr:sugar ABC transporter permease [Spirochaetaceae bacterium]GMO27824.1 MAG: sugar ABC transporter permease GguB [Termitinemataceae bacterium]
MTGNFNIKQNLKQNIMLIALIGVMLVFELAIQAQAKPSLFSPGNISNLISQNAYVVVLATGMLLCILTGGNIDLSVGSVVCFVGAVAGTLIVDMQMNIYLAVICCLLVGLAIGSFQAFWIAYVRIPPFIVTLAGMLLWRGLANMILGGLTISPFPANYLRYFTSFIPGGENASLTSVVSVVIGIVVSAVYISFEVLGRIKKIRKKYATTPFPVWIAKIIVISAVILALAFLLGNNKGIPVILVLIGIVVLGYGYFTSKTVPGRYLYAIGGNEKAAKMSGVDTNKMLFFAYANMGFLAGLTALICVARFNSASPSAGNNYELDAIASCFIGGASAYGGVGSVGGAVIGAIFMGVLNQGMSIVGGVLADANFQRAVKGAVLLLFVVIDVVSKKKK